MLYSRKKISSGPSVTSSGARSFSQLKQHLVINLRRVDVVEQELRVVRLQQRFLLDVLERWERNITKDEDQLTGKKRALDAMSKEISQLGFEVQAIVGPSVSCIPGIKFCPPSVVLSAPTACIDWDKYCAATEAAARLAR